MNRLVECPNCFHKTRIDPALSGDTVRCLKCGQDFSTADTDPEATYGLGVRPCPSCGKDCAPEAVVCIECGFNFQTKKRHRTKHEPFHAAWESTLSFGTRLILFGVLEIICLAGFFLGWKIGLLILAAGTLGGIIWLGSYRQITLSRGPEGKALLRVRRWYAFCPFVDRIFNLKHYRNVTLHYKGPSGDSQPALLSYLDDDDYSAEWFTLKIVRIDGQADTILTSSDEDEIRSIGEMICKVGGLRFG